MSTGGFEPDQWSAVADTPDHGEPAVADTPHPGEPAVPEAPRRLQLDVAITDVGPAKKHLKITIPRAEIERQFEESLESLRNDTRVPDFGRAAHRGN